MVRLVTPVTGAAARNGGETEQHYDAAHVVGGGRERARGGACGVPHLDRRPGRAAAGPRGAGGAGPRRPPAAPGGGRRGVGGAAFRRRVVRGGPGRAGRSAAGAGGGRERPDPAV